MKIKKILILTTAVTMLTGVATGCGKNSSDTENRKTGKSEKTTDFDISSLTPDNWEDYLEYEIKNDKVIITGYTKSPKYIIIPDTIEGYPVTEIGDRAFKDCWNLEAVKIGNNIERIGGRAFEYSDLKYIDIPDNVTFIYSDAFEGTPICKKCKAGIIYVDGWAIGYAFEDGKPVDYHSEVTEKADLVFESGTKGIAYGAFAQCDFIKSIVIPDIPYIEESSFFGCDGLETVTLGDGVKEIRDYAFALCSHLETVDIGNDVNSIGEQAFLQCNWLGNVNIGKNVNTIGTAAFKECKNLTEITIPENVESISSSAFEDCRNLTSVTFSEGLGSIGANAFSGCGITEVMLPKGLTSIGTGAFSGCGITEITIPEHVERLTSMSFYGCDSLKSITFEGTDCKIHEDWGTIPTGSTIHGYAGSTAEEYAEKNSFKFELIE